MTGGIELERALAEHGSPLWLVDLDRVRANWRAFGDAWRAVWPDVALAYSYKTNREPAILRALAAEGALPEVVCEAELLLAEAVAGTASGAAAPVVNGPAKPPALLHRAAVTGALVIADAEAELERIAAAGVRRAGVRVALPGIGAEPTRFGIQPDRVPGAVERARALGLEVQALSAHLVSTGFSTPLDATTARPGAALTVQWPRPPHSHAEAAALLARLATELGIGTVDLGGGHPAAPAVEAHAHAVATALRRTAFAGRLLLEPGRAIVADAVDLACTVIAVKTLAGGERCVVLDAGTNLLPGVLWSPPRLETTNDADGAPPHPAPARALVTGPLCLNVDVLHPAADLPDLAPGDVVRARAVGAYQQAQSTQFGDLRPAVLARDGGRVRLCRRRETVDDLLAGDTGPAALAAVAGARHEEETEP